MIDACVLDADVGLSPGLWTLKKIHSISPTTPILLYRTPGPWELEQQAYIEGADAMVIITEWDQFRALDLDTTEKTFEAIDRAQKIEFQAKSYLLKTELFAWFAVPGGLLLLLGALLALPPRWPFARRQTSGSSPKGALASVASAKEAA